MKHGDLNSGARRVELTPTWPVLTRGQATSIGVFETYEVDEPTWARLMDVLQTGQLDNAKVKEILGIE